MSSGWDWIVLHLCFSICLGWSGLELADKMELMNIWLLKIASRICSKCNHSPLFFHFLSVNSSKNIFLFQTCDSSHIARYSNCSISLTPCDWKSTWLLKCTKSRTCSSIKSQLTPWRITTAAFNVTACSSQETLLLEEKKFESKSFC